MPLEIFFFRRDSKCLATPCRLGFCGKCEHRWCREAGQKAATVHHALPQGRGLQCRFARREDSRRSRRLLAESPMGGRRKPRCVLRVEPEDHQKIDEANRRRPVHITLCRGGARSAGGNDRAARNAGAASPCRSRCRSGCARPCGYDRGWVRRSHRRFLADGRIR